MRAHQGYNSGMLLRNDPVCDNQASRGRMYPQDKPKAAKEQDFVDSRELELPSKPTGKTRRINAQNEDGSMAEDSKHYSVNKSQQKIEKERSNKQPRQRGGSEEFDRDGSEQEVYDEEKSELSDAHLIVEPNKLQGSRHSQAPLVDQMKMFRGT